MKERMNGGERVSEYNQRVLNKMSKIRYCDDYPRLQAHRYIWRKGWKRRKDNEMLCSTYNALVPIPFTPPVVIPLIPPPANVVTFMDVKFNTRI